MKTRGQLHAEQRGRVLLLTLTDPATRNALHPDIYRAGIEALHHAQGPTVGAVVLTGANGVFCSGGNLNRLRANRDKPSTVQQDSITLFHQWVRAIRQCPRPVIAAVEGAAAGAGFSLALACDLLVAAEDADFSMAYIKVGLTPDGGATVFLTRALAPQIVAEILLTGHRIAATRLYQLGVVNRLCAKGQALAMALDLAEKLAEGPPAALARVKQLLNAALADNLDMQLERERAFFLAGLYHPECAEGITAFLEKRPAVFRDEDS